MSPPLAAVIAAEIVLKPGFLHDPPLVPVLVGDGATNQVVLGLSWENAAGSRADVGNADIRVRRASASSILAWFMIFISPWSWVFLLAPLLGAVYIDM